MWLLDDKTGELVLSPVVDRPKLRKPGTKRGPRKGKEGAVPDIPGDVSPLPPDQQGAVSSAAEEIALEDRPEMHTPQGPAVSVSGILPFGD